MKVLATDQTKNGQQHYLHQQTFENEFKKEAAMLKTLNHPHIIKIVNSKVGLDEENIEGEKRTGSGGGNRSGEESRKSQKSNSSSGSNEEVNQTEEFSKYIILEYAENGDLFDFLISIAEPFGEDIARYYFSQLLSATEYLHLDQKLIHRDFKLENVLVDSQFNLKVCDFTLAKTIAEGSVVGVFYSHCGTVRYMAPEIHEGKPYKGSTTDIFALGVILFVMVTGVMPFYLKAVKTDTLYQHIYKNDEKLYWETLGKTYPNLSFLTISDDFKKFIWQFFMYHYFERITLDKIRGSKWIQ